jgi:hypothetical protein
VRTAGNPEAKLLPAGIALVIALAVAGCGPGSPAQRDAGHDGTTDASYWYQEAGPEDGPRPRPDVAPIPGLSVTVDGVPWYVLNGSTSWAPAQAMSYVTAMVSCDQCTDTAQFVISARGVSENSWVSSDCGPSANTITFTRTSISTHPWKSGLQGNCGFNISEAGGGELGEPPSVRVVGSFHGKVINIDSQVTVTYDLGVDFDLALGASFP